MISGIFKSNQLLYGYGITTALVFIVVFWSSFGVTPPAVLFEGEHLLMGALRQLPSPVLHFLQALMIAGGGIMFNQLLVNEKISRDYNALFLLGYVMAALSFEAWRLPSGAFFSGFLLLMVIRNLMIAGNSKRQLSLVFDAGFLGGLAYLLYEPAWVLLLISFFGIVLGGFFRLKALLIWLFGYLTPLYLFASVAYLRNQMGWLTDLIPQFEREIWLALVLSWQQKMLLAVSLAVLILGILFSFTTVNLKTNALRNAQRLFFICLLCTVPTLWFLPASGWMMAAMFVPISAFYMGRFLEAVPGNGWFSALIISWLILLGLPLLPIP